LWCERGQILDLALLFFADGQHSIAFTVPVGLGVRTDAPKPDISSAEGLKRALLAAKSIAITDPATGGVSGVHIAEVFQRLGIAEELKRKTSPLL
jgi:hypothetical protein